jgi:alkanesulfonate monooxygenase SsuD/methylene tetrahydromethanopterin reductase-like flavin-dependent oxidoreductase (luciferase family)
VTASALQYGLYLPPFGPFSDPVAVVDLAVRAEAAGWDGVFLWDHLVHDDLPVVDPWTTLAAIAQATSRIRIGPMVTPLARRRPWLVARQAATVQRLSGGRLILGTGLGSDESGDFSRFGEPSDLRTRATLYDEGLDILDAVWSGRRYRHSGSHYQVDLEPGAPIPVPIPVWVAAGTDRPAVRRRALGRDGIFPNPDDRTLTATDVSSLLRDLRADGLTGERRFEVVVAGNASPAWGEPMDVDLPGLAAAGMTWWMESLIHFDPLDLSLTVVDAGPPRIPLP